MEIKLNKMAPIFAPIKIEITIESQKELDALKELSGSNVSTARYVMQGSEKSDFVTLSNILGDIYEKIHKL